jgi:DNA-binding protein YbaB
VVIVLDGNGDMKSIKIDPKILEKGSDFVQDLVAKAYSDAKLKAGITSPNTAVNLMGQFMSKNFFR